MLVKRERERERKLGKIDETRQSKSMDRCARLVDGDLGAMARNDSGSGENVGANDNVPPSSLHLHRGQLSSFAIMAVLVVRLHPGDDVPRR